MKHRLAVSALFILVLLSAAISWNFLKWSENVDDLLPKSPGLADYMELIRLFRPDERVIFLVKKIDEKVPEQELIRAADSLAVRLGEIFPRVIYRQDIDPLEAIDFFLAHQDYFFDESMQEQATLRLNSEWLKERFAGVKKELLNSTSPGLMKVVAGDPLDLCGVCFQSLEEMLPVQESIALHRGRLFGPGYSSILVIAETGTESTDIARARELNTRVKQVIEDIGSAREGIRVAWLAGLRFSVENASIVRHDIGRVFIISSLLIIIFMWLALRSIVSVLLLALPPIFGLAAAFSLVTAIKGSISAIALGMAAILAGITIDYGIHILCHGRSLGNFRQASIVLRRPLMMAAATTAIAFASLIFSRMVVLQQFGIIAVLCVLTAAAFALTCLPEFFSWARLDLRPQGHLDIGWPARRIIELAPGKQITLLIVLSLLLIPGFTRLHVEDDLQVYNAMFPDTRRDYEELSEITGLNRPTIYAVVYGDDTPGVYERNSDLLDLLNQEKEKGSLTRISSIARVIPGSTRQAENRKRWQEYWNDERRSRFTKALESAVDEVGMKTEVFQSYLQKTVSPLPAGVGLINRPGLPGSLRSLVDEHIRKDREKIYILTRIEPAPGCDVKRLTDSLRKAIPGLITADMGLLRHSAMGLIINALLKFSAIVLVSVFIFLLLILKKIRHAAALIFPLILAALWTFGFLGWLQVKVDASSSIIGVVIFGLVIDYNIFINNSINRRGGSDKEFAVVATALTLSGVTTILGFGSLILAQHPVLFSCGLTAIAGTFWGWTAVSLSFFIHGRQREQDSPGGK